MAEQSKAASVREVGDGGPDWTPEEYAWSCAEDMRGWALRAEEKLRELREALEQAREIADVMIGDGPGAIKAYYGPHDDGFPRGLPTTFAHLRDHAKEIRRIVNGVIGDRA